MSDPTSKPAFAVSVIVPTHDRRELLQRKLAALEGEGGNFEVIVVADACSDDTEEFLTDYRPDYPLSWTTGPGRHAATARNIGAGLARAPILLFSDDDVVPTPGWVEENRRLHAKPNRVGLSRQELPAHLEQGAALKALHGWWNVNGASLSLRAELFERVGGYDPSFAGYGGEDPDLGWRLKRAGAKFRLLTSSPVEHWDEGYLESLEEKGRAAGAAHVRVWRKYDAPAVAWALGVHPLSLAVKRLLLNRAGALLLGAERYRWERAYAAGASAELNKAPGER